MFARDGKLKSTKVLNIVAKNIIKYDNLNCKE